MRKKQYGIIFDMDNTLLQSKIDFAGMKRAVFEELARRELCVSDLEWKNYTTSQLIEMARQSRKMEADAEAVIWEIVAGFERDGMQDAILEPYVSEMLAEIHAHSHMTVLTNNACSAAVEALTRTGIAHYFDYIAGREQMTALKPSPSGVRYILQQYPHMSEECWTFVGDSWIDGKAAGEGGIRFVAYKSSADEMEQKGVCPHVYISHMRELVAFMIQA